MPTTPPPPNNGAFTSNTTATQTAPSNGKVPYYVNEPSADPVLVGSRPNDAPKNPYRGNRRHLEPGIKTDVGNGGISQTGVWYQLESEKATKDAGGTPKTTPYSPT